MSDLKAWQQNLGQRLPLLVFLLIFAFNLAVFVSRWDRLTSKFTRPEMCTRDFVSLYVIGRSAWTGVNPYQPIPQLENQFASAMGNCHSGFPHASPHPPVLALLCAPMGLVSYDAAVFGWLVFQCGLLLVTISLLARWWGHHLQWWEHLLMALAFLFSGPMVSELRTGQVNSLLVTLLVCSWLALRHQRDLSGGAWLGLSIAVKLMGWPILLYLMVTRRWKAVSAAIAVFIVSNALAALVLGFTTVKDYFVKVGPAVTQYYSQNTASYSAWTIGPRLFGASNTPSTFFGIAVPLWHAPWLAKIMAVTLPLTLVAAALYFAYKAASFDAAFSLLLTVSLLTNPVAWSHYVVLLVIPVHIIARRLRLAAYPKAWLLAATAIYLLNIHFTALAILGLLFLLALMNRLSTHTTDNLPNHPVTSHA